MPGQVLWLAKILAGKKYRYLLINSLVGQNSRAVGKQSAFGWPAILAKQSAGKQKSQSFGSDQSDVPVRPFAPVLMTPSVAAARLRVRPLILRLPALSISSLPAIEPAPSSSPRRNSTAYSMLSGGAPRDVLAVKSSAVTSSRYSPNSVTARSGSAVVGLLRM
jgi:hypothetical protein